MPKLTMTERQHRAMVAVRGPGPQPLEILPNGDRVFEVPQWLYDTAQRARRPGESDQQLMERALRNLGVLQSEH